MLLERKATLADAEQAIKYAEKNLEQMVKADDRCRYFCAYHNSTASLEQRLYADKIKRVLLQRKATLADAEPALNYSESSDEPLSGS